jgi:sRNA-binding regulator protein Hfq
MKNDVTLSNAGKTPVSPVVRTPSSARRNRPVIAPIHYAAYSSAPGGSQHQTEHFYLQKQIQTQTPMVLILEDGEQLEGCIEWYDSNTLKVRGRQKTLVYKSALKYMYKLGDSGQ